MREPSRGAEGAGIFVRRRIVEGAGTFRPVQISTPGFGSSVRNSPARAQADIPAGESVKEPFSVVAKADPLRSTRRLAEVDAVFVARLNRAPDTHTARLVPRPAKASEVEPARKSARERLRELPRPATTTPRVQIAADLPGRMNRPLTRAEPAPKHSRANAPNAEIKAWRLLNERQPPGSARSHRCDPRHRPVVPCARRDGAAATRSSGWCR